MPDLASIVFPLHARVDTSLPLSNGRIMQGALLNWLQQDVPELAVKLHDQYQRFYTVSGLHGQFVRDGRWLQVRQGESGWFRVTAMHAELVAALLRVAETTTTGPQPADAAWLSAPAMTDPEAHEWVRLTTFEALAQQAQTRAEQGELAPEVTLRFIASTCFMENEQSLPLPIPRYVFGYLFNQWQIASPFPLPVEDVDHFIESIHLAYTNIKTQFMDYKKFKRVGFVGLARFGLHPKFPPLYRMLLHLLARFAFYSGIGSHTTMGMGQVAVNSEQ